MISTPVIRRFRSLVWRIYKDLRLGALADSPDAFGRTLDEEKDLSDADWSNRLASGVASRLDLPLMAEAAAEPIGLAWGRIESSNSDVAHLYQMWVAHAYGRPGAGQMLLEARNRWDITARSRRTISLVPSRPPRGIVPKSRVGFGIGAAD